jgi:hypothetical protein
VLTRTAICLLNIETLHCPVLPGTYVCMAQVGLTPSVDANDLFVLKRR